MWKALALMLVAMSCIPAGDTAGKILMTGHGVAPGFVAWARFAAGAAMVAPFALGAALPLLADWRVWGRGLLLAGTVLSILTALETAPLGAAFAAFFIGPIVSFALSALVLREPVSAARTLFMGLGFLGVLLVVRPGFGMAPGLGYAMLAGVFYGAFLTASRALASRGRAGGLLLIQLLAAALVLAPFALGGGPSEWSATTLSLLAASAAFSAGANALLLLAYRIGTASALAPMVYFQLVAATLLGWAVFGDLPDALTWAGLAVIICAGVISARLGRASFAAPAAARADRG